MLKRDNVILYNISASDLDTVASSLSVIGKVYHDLDFVQLILRPRLYQ